MPQNFLNNDMNRQPETTNNQATAINSDSPINNAVEPGPQSGLRTPLFERISNDSSTVFMNIEQTKASIHKSVTTLLNTKLSATAPIYATYKQQPHGLGLPWMYGVPDPASINAANSKDWWQLSKLYEQAIGYFEPRITHVKVQIINFDGPSQTLNIQISGELKLQNYQTQLKFQLSLKSGA